MDRKTTEANILDREALKAKLRDSVEKRSTSSGDVCARYNTTCPGSPCPLAAAGSGDVCAPAYPQVYAAELGSFYTRHVCAMTREGLHAKSDIAMQLAWRDIEIDNLTAQVEDLRALVRSHTTEHLERVTALRAEVDGLRALERNMAAIEFEGYASGLRAAARVCEALAEKLYDHARAPYLRAAAEIKKKVSNG